MATVRKDEEIVQVRSRDVRVSDFSGVEIPTDLRWEAVTRIRCDCRDGSGNLRNVFDLDLMPEEMKEFRHDLIDLIGRHKRMAQAKGGRNAND